ncbi:hypothetical protein [Rathayibacter sp. VKM Ac-2760]|uniref:hypothetical protein n=1 Tax=Rathayibacter sp. VKM Ac-2760 TaxID=2609253 RepID=UPI001ABE6D8F|nr:hypothetical protein [Rathayibacter sp. VKM Ac-2760]
MMNNAEHLIERTAFPRNAETARPLESDFGGQFEWFWGAPDVMRAAASSGALRRLPASPRYGDPHAQSLGYWSALQTLLLHRLGWTRPDLGLTWWYEAGKPSDDATLRTIREVWDADGNLDIILAWLLRRRAVFPVGRPGQACTPSADSERPLPDRWDRWLRDYQASPRASSYEWINLLEGDSLHLSGHIGDDGTVDSSAYLVPIDPARRKAVFVTSAADAWYADLKRRGDRLTVTGNRSWNVDVFIKPIGFVGTYRRSMQTGLWFTGRHRYHIVGN